MMKINGLTGSVRSFPVVGILVLAGGIPAGTLSAGVSVYRCTDSAGRVELRQTYCPAGEQQRIQVDTSNTGWVRPKRPDSSRRQRGTEKRSAGGRQTGPKKSNEGAEDAFRQRCWKTEKKLERVQRQLRQGYRPAQGEKLRQRRREHEQYLQRFCRK